MILVHIALSAAFAQDVTGGEAPPFNVQTLRPSGDSHEYFRVIDSDMPNKGFSAYGLFQYATDPLEYTFYDGRTESISGDLVQFDGILNFALEDFRIGVAVPVLLRSFGGTIPEASGIGDLALDAKYRLKDSGEKGMGYAVVARRQFKTSNLPDGLSAASSSWDLAFAADYRASRAFGLAANIGTTTHPTVELEGATWGRFVYGQFGIDVKASDKLGFVGELHAAKVPGTIGEGSWRTEALLGANIRSGNDSQLVIRPGFGFALVDAVGAPEYRAMLAFGYDPVTPWAPVDSDGDGLVGDADACPDVAEDMDAYEDSDGCAEPTLVSVEAVDTDGVAISGRAWTAAVADGAPVSGTTTGGTEAPAVGMNAGEATFTVDGASAKATIPNGAPTTVKLVFPAPRTAVKVEVRDPAGKPIPAATWKSDGTVAFSGTGDAEVQARPGAYTIDAQAEGFRAAKVSVKTAEQGPTTVLITLQPSKAALVGARIDIKDSVYFEINKFDIKPESFGLLDEVAQILKDHPELTKIRIEGHTDARGNDQANLALSKGRAKAVVDYLVAKGVEASRLESEGYGETRPLVKGNNEAAWAKNRRVDFKVVARSDGK